MTGVESSMYSSGCSESEVPGNKTNQWVMEDFGGALAIRRSRLHAEPLNDPRNEPVGAIAIFLIGNSEGIRQNAFLLGDSPEVGRNDGHQNNEGGAPVAYGQSQPGKTQQCASIRRMAHYAVRPISDQPVSRLDPVGHFKIPHLWSPKIPQAGRVDYQLTEGFCASRVTASLSR